MNNCPLCQHPQTAVYAILISGQVVILMECEYWHQSLNVQPVSRLIGENEMIYKSFTLKSSREGVTWFVTAKNQADQTDIVITHNAIEMRAVKEAKAKIDEREKSNV